jgi:hypothetical protein
MATGHAIAWMVWTMAVVRSVSGLCDYFSYCECGFSDRRGRNPHFSMQNMNIVFCLIVTRFIDGSLSVSERKPGQLQPAGLVVAA